MKQGATQDDSGELGDRIWHRSYAPGVPRSIDFEDITAPEVLARTAGKFPRRTALLFMGKKISYAELDRSVSRFANALLALGVQPADKVALLLPNIPNIVIAYYGIWRMGAVPVPNNPMYTDRELEAQLNDSGATALVTLDLLAPRMLALRPKTKLKQIITCHANDYLPFPAKPLFPLVKKEMYVRYEKAPDYYEFHRLMGKASSAFKGRPPSLDDIALIPYTGGTTGVSKGVVLTHRNVTCKNQMLEAWFSDMKDLPERELAIFPFFHLAGFTAVMTFAIRMGWTDILVPRPEARTVLNMMIKHKPTVVPAVPTIYVGLLGLPEFKDADLSFVKGFFCAAAPLALETINDLKEATGAQMVEGYGLSESTGLVTLTPWRGVLKQGSAGVPLPDTDMKVVDLETGTTELPVGQEGEIIFRGPQMCKGYYNMQEETAKAIRDGWFHTGDIGKVDEDGYVTIVDRKKDMIIAGGYNIYPRDIDEVLFEHPKVLEACAVGVPHAYRGETVKAFVVPKPGETITEEELDAYCRANLAAYKVPKAYEFMESLPKSSVGKVLRRELREMEQNKRGAH
jgi:long-chain acyl-CoA synthetase